VVALVERRRVAIDSPWRIGRRWASLADLVNNGQEPVRLGQEKQKYVDCGERPVKGSTVRDDSFTMASNVDLHELGVCQQSKISVLHSMDDKQEPRSRTESALSSLLHGPNTQSPRMSEKRHRTSVPRYLVYLGINGPCGFILSEKKKKGPIFVSNLEGPINA
jgi:hypothetical protein